MSNNVKHMKNVKSKRQTGQNAIAAGDYEGDLFEKHIFGQAPQFLILSGAFIFYCIAVNK